jgi:hypothetical protein
MSIQDWGSIGELIAAIATLGTLIYLAIQIRQNTKTIQLSAERGVWGDAQDWMGRVVENPELAGLYRRGMNGEKLEPDERLRFRLLLNMLFSHWNHAYEANQFRIVHNSNIKGVVSQPGGLRYWKKNVETNESAFDPGFVDFINSIVEEVEGDA